MLVGGGRRLISVESVRVLCADRQALMRISGCNSEPNLAERASAKTFAKVSLSAELPHVVPGTCGASQGTIARLDSAENFSTRIMNIQAVLPRASRIHAYSVRSCKRTTPDLWRSLIQKMANSNVRSWRKLREEGMRRK